MGEKDLAETSPDELLEQRIAIEKRRQKELIEKVPLVIIIETKKKISGQVMQNGFGQVVKNCTVIDNRKGYFSDEGTFVADRKEELNTIQPYIDIFLEHKCGFSKRKIEEALKKETRNLYKQINAKYDAELEVIFPAINIPPTKENDGEEGNITPSTTPEIITYENHAEKLSPLPVFPAGGKRKYARSVTEKDTFSGVSDKIERFSTFEIDVESGLFRIVPKEVMKRVEKEFLKKNTTVHGCKKEDRDSN